MDVEQEMIQASNKRKVWDESTSDRPTMQKLDKYFLVCWLIPPAQLLFWKYQGQAQWQNEPPDEPQQEQAWVKRRKGVVSEEE